MRVINRRLLFVVILVCVGIMVSTVIALAFGFRNPPLPTGSEWNCPRMLKTKQEWDSLSQTITQTKDEYQKLQHSLDNILQKNLSDHNIHQLATSCGTLAPKSKDRSDFDNAVLRYVVQSLVASGDRDNLLKILSTRCPNQIYEYEYIEFHLVLRGKKLKDPIMILGEAYSKCQDEKVRHVIAAAIHRGFADHGIAGKDDAEYINNAMQWYQKEKDHLVINEKYGRNAHYYSWEDYERNPKLYKKWPSLTREPLFIKKQG